MTHRDRVLAALSHRETDRVPIDLGSTRNSSMVAPGYERLKAHFGVAAETRLISRMMQVVEIDEPVLQALDVDVRGIFPGPPDSGRDVEIGPDRYLDEWGIERVRPAGALYYDLAGSPLSGEITVHDIARYPWPDPSDPGRLRGLKERLHQIRTETDCAAVLNLPSAFVHVTQYLRGFEEWFIDIAANRAIAEALFDAVLEVNLAVCEALLREVGDAVDVLIASDDLGLQDGLMISVPAYRALIRPRHERYFRRLHELSPAKVLFHTCGSVACILDDLIDTGVDALHPVQVRAAGMDPAALKERYAGRLAFWGAIDTQHVLPHGTAAEVEAEVDRVTGILGVGGGYVLGAVHNIQPDVPTGNVLAMFGRVVRDARERASGVSTQRHEGTKTRSP